MFLGQPLIGVENHFWAGVFPLLETREVKRERGARAAVRRQRVWIRGLVTVGIWSSFLLFVPQRDVSAQGIYKIEPHLSQIKGTVKYTVLGKYVAWFQKFKGTFVFDPERLEKSTVTLSVNAASLHSSHPRLDRMAKSKRLLYTKKFPEFVFVSQSIRRSPGGDGHRFEVAGLLTMRGVTKELHFPFNVTGPEGDKKNRRIKASGTWVINRKDFGIFWHEVLDHGGIIVGDHLTVHWQLVGIEKDVRPPDGTGAALPTAQPSR